MFRDFLRTWPNGVGFLFLSLAALFQAVCIFQPLTFLLDVIFERDDAFYYLQMARVAAETGQASFDGIHASSGVQFLWYYILVALAHLVSDQIDFLRAALGLCLALNIVAGALIWELGRRIHSVRAGDIALLFWAGIMVERWHTLQGMEFSLNIAIILVILIVVHGIWRNNMLTPGRAALLGLLLTLNFWTRLDAAIFSVAIWFFLVWLIRQPTRSAQVQLACLVALTMPPAIGTIGYLWVSHAMADTWLPLSGSVKRHYADVFFEGFDLATVLKEKIKWVLKLQGVIPLGLVPETLFDVPVYENYKPSNPVHLALPIVSVALVAVGAFWLWSKQRWLVISGLVLWTIALGHMAISIYTLGDFAHITRHYYGWLLVFWLVWGALLVASLLEALPRLLQGAVGAGFLLALAAAYGAGGYRFISAYEAEPESYALSRYALSQRLNETLPAEARIGAWNAGVLGYFLERPVINLDGLVNDKAFSRVLRSGAPLQGYMRDVGITHLIDHNRRDLTLRFQEMRDTDAEFRNGITWDEVEVLEKLQHIYVLRWRG